MKQFIFGLCFVVLTVAMRYRATHRDAPVATSEQSREHGPPAAPWTNYVLPDAPGWARETPEDRGPADGVSVRYRSLRGTAYADLFVYRGPEGLSREREALDREVERACDGVRQAVSVGAYERAAFYWSTRHMPFGGAEYSWVRFTVTQRGVTRASEVYVTTHRAFFVKLRVTYNDENPPSDDTRDVHALVTAVGEAAQP